MMARKTYQPIHPGEILMEEFLEPMGISQYRLAKDTSVPPRRINEIVHGKRSITADTALRLARFFGDRGNRDRLHMVLQNAIATETVEAQISDDRGEASGGSWKRAMWFALPLYGAVMLDALVKGLR